MGSKKDFSPFLTLACFPSWSLDDNRLAYVTKDQPGGPLYKLTISNADGTDPKPLFSNDETKNLYSPTWSPDGTQIAFAYDGQEGTNAIYIVEVPEDLHP